MVLASQVTTTVVAAAALIALHVHNCRGAFLLPRFDIYRYHFLSAALSDTSDVRETRPAFVLQSSRTSEQHGEQIGGEDTQFRSRNIFGKLQNPIKRKRHSHQHQWWLDLRGTAISPTEALQMLDQMTDHVDEPEEGRDWIDGILLDETSFFEFIHDGSSQQNCMDMLIFYTTENGDLVVSDFDQQQSFPIGRVMTTTESANSSIKPGSIVADPLVALDAISEGLWIFLDTPSTDTKINSDRATYKQVSDLVEFISSVPLTTTTRENGLWLSSPLSTSRYDDFTASVLSTASSSTASAGLAITCHTPSSLVQLDALIMSHSSSMSGSSNLASVTDSGILLPSTTSGGAISKPSLSYALVLPFDTRMWVTAIELQQLIKRQEEGEDEERQRESS